MSILDRYIGRYILQGYALVFAALLGLFSIIRFTVELEDVGNGSYSVLDALYYVVLTLPSQLIQLAPVSAMLGSLLALVNLSHHGEFVAMRIAGYSTARIFLAVARPAVGLMLLLLLLTEVISPVLYQYAVQMRNQAVLESGVMDVVSDQQTWSKNANQFINIGTLEYGRVPADIRIYEFAEDRRLLKTLSARRAQILANGDWKLSQVKLGEYRKNSWHISTFDEYLWQSFLTHEQAEKQFFPLASLSLRNHWQYLNYLYEANLKMTEVGLSFWVKVAQPLVVLLMALLSMVVVFVSPRSTHSVGYLVSGVLFAVTFMLGRQVIHNIGLVLDVSPPLTALIPLLLLFSANLWLFWWYRKRV